MYGIERSAIAEQARQIVEDNSYQDRITIIQGKVEEVDLPVPQVLSQFHLLPAERKRDLGRFSSYNQQSMRPLSAQLCQAKQSPSLGRILPTSQHFLPGTAGILEPFRRLCLL